MLRSKFVGSLVGSAVGDALGRVFEGSRISDVRMEHARMKRFSGRWTDDTHMMLGVAESLIINKSFDGSHMAQTFIKNYELEPWRGYASGPPRVFRWIKSGVAWNVAGKRLFGGAGSYGNGAAMRVAPIGVFYYDDPERLRSVAYNQSQITHAHELGMEGAAIQAYAVALAVNADPSSKMDSQVFLDKLKDFTRNEIYKRKLERVWEMLGEMNRIRVVRELGNGIEAHNSVPTAIYSFLRNWNSFEDSILYAVSLGGDADTIGAMTGAISGAYHGIEAIPQQWKSRLERIGYIEDLAEKLWVVKTGESSINHRRYKISSSEFKELLPEDMQRLFNDLVFALMRHGGIKMAEAEEIALTEFLKVKNIRINYFAMPSIVRDSFVSKWALTILDKSSKGNGKHKDPYRCKKCGVETSPAYEFWGYCDKCREEFDTAIRNGALVLYKGISSTVSPPVHYWMIRRYSPEEPDKQYFHFNQVQAIVEARRIAKKEGIDRIVFVYSPHLSIWFLDKYLEAHPSIKEDVLRAEASKLRRLKEHVMKWMRSSVL